MESNASAPSGASETPNPAGFSAPRKRPNGAFKGIGFVLPVWVEKVLSKGLLTKSRAVVALWAIADTVDADGRWCFFLLENMAKKPHCTLSVSSLKRAINDLVEAGIVHKLTRSEAIDFFAEDIERGRSPYQLPCVLELLVPAKDYSEQALAEINTRRARLGEEPLTEHNRPALKRRRPTPAQSEPAPSSNRATDCSPGDCSGSEVDSSVRGTSSTGEQTRQKPRSGIFSIINCIPNSFLSSPDADRNLLALALEKLLRQGLSEADARALFSGMERARRPFPMLMRRLFSMKNALDFLNGSLGQGIHASSLRTAPWPDSGRDRTSGQYQGFWLDSLGQATGTCPAHATTRNIPGGRCKICGGLCRSQPGQIVSEPARGADTPIQGSPESAPAPEPSGPPPGTEENLDPELKAQMLGSLNGGGRTPTTEPASKSTVRPA